MNSYKTQRNQDRLSMWYKTPENVAKPSLTRWLDATKKGGRMYKIRMKNFEYPKRIFSATDLKVYVAHILINYFKLGCI